MKENISPLLPPARNISKPDSVKAEQTIKPAQPLSNGSHNSIPNSINNGNVRVTEGGIVFTFAFFILLNKKHSDVLFFPS